MGSKLAATRKSRCAAGRTNTAKNTKETAFCLIGVKTVHSGSPEDTAAMRISGVVAIFELITVFKSTSPRVLILVCHLFLSFFFSLVFHILSTLKNTLAHMHTDRHTHTIESRDSCVF